MHILVLPDCFYFLFRLNIFNYLKFKMTQMGNNWKHWQKLQNGSPAVNEIGWKQPSQPLEKLWKSCFTWSLLPCGCFSVKSSSLKTVPEGFYRFSTLFGFCECTDDLFLFLTVPEFSHPGRCSSSTGKLCLIYFKIKALNKRKCCLKLKWKKHSSPLALANLTLTWCFCMFFPGWMTVNK